MCTLIVARNVYQLFPLVVAANRDERLDRPSAPPALRHDLDPLVLAPADLEGGGTWIGVNAAGVFAGITNRADVPARDGLASRGALVLQALGERDARKAAQRLSRTDGRAYNGFRLVIADREDTFLVSGDGMGVRLDPLGSGLHVVTNLGFGPDSCARAANAAVAYRRHARHCPPTPAALGAMLGVHGSSPLDGTCVHMPERGYGTRSSTIVRMDDRGARFGMWHREGPACGGPFGRPNYLKISG
ncbi:MAG TPA: NRDE family protein [Candidatus Binatia bacterium]|nr:NRDE family protein [Candidatus Binatia bacterium]